MLQRQSQTAAFWRDQFEVAADDAEYLYNLLLDSQTPRSLGELATSLIEEYLRRENARIEQELSKGKMYVPKDRYGVGQTLVFPALEFAAGEVTEVRPGHNPEHGPFDVITVQLPEGPREFAAALQTPHRLNQSSGNELLDDSALVSADEIYQLYKSEIEESLLYALEEGERSKDFVSVDGSWLLADMLTEVHVGHLNLAEAIIEEQGQPVSPSQILDVLDLDENASEAMRMLSLDHAMSDDPRFDAVERGGQRLWFLRRMEPRVVVEAPRLLTYRPVRYNRSLLSVELLQLEWELDDEWGESSLNTAMPSAIANTSFVLTYPHRRYGTIPLSSRTRSFCPSRSGGRSLVTLVDGRWGTRYTGWVVHEGRYVAGLAKWMDDHVLPVGAYITLERSSTPGEIVVDYRTRRAKREWARIATADLDVQRLLFEMNKVQVACEYDEQIIVAENDPEPIEALGQELESRGVELAQIVEQVTPELTKLNPQGTVHAKSVYSAVNVVRRSPPGPIFYALISSRRFRDAGGGFFALV